MANCPHCKTPLADDFGLLECSNCHASVFVGMDGEVVQGNMNTKPNIAVPKEQESVQQQATQVVQDLESFGQSLEDEKQFVAEAMAMMDGAPEPEPVHHQEEHQAMTVEPTTMSTPAPVSEEPEEDRWKVPATAEEALAEVVEYGNQDHTYQQEGPLSYSVIFSGIDSSDLEEKIKEVLTDKKLAIDMEKLWPTLKKGQLKITNLSPTKAYVLVSKLYHLPISIEWEQHVLSE